MLAAITSSVKFPGPPTPEEAAVEVAASWFGRG